MFLSKLRILTVVCLALVLLGSGAGVLRHPGLAGEQGQSEKQAAGKRPEVKDAAAPTLLLKDLVLEAVDAAHSTVTVTSGTGTVIGVPAKRRAALTVAEGSDEQYIRRVTLDILGTLPTVAEVKLFLEDKNPDKRRKLVDTLLDKPDRKLVADAWGRYLVIMVPGPNETRLQGLLVATDADVEVDRAPAKLSDLKAGMTLQVSLGVEEGRLVVKSIRAAK